MKIQSLFTFAKDIRLCRVNACHTYSEPVFITKNGKGDLAVMSIEAYEHMVNRFELYSQIKEGLDDIAAGNTRPFSEAMADIRKKRKP